MANQPIEIKIKVDEHGSFTYVPALLRAHPGDQISWSCDNGDFTVSFDQGTPFEDREFHSCGAGGAPGAPRRTAVHGAPRRTAARTIQAREHRVYHYHVAVATRDRNGKTVIFVDSGCPGIGTGP